MSLGREWLGVLKPLSSPVIWASVLIALGCVSSRRWRDWLKHFILFITQQGCWELDTRGRWKCSPIGGMTKEQLYPLLDIPPPSPPMSPRKGCWPILPPCGHFEGCLSPFWGLFQCSEVSEGPFLGLLPALPRSARGGAQGTPVEMTPSSLFVFPLLPGQLVAQRLDGGGRRNRGVCLRWLFPNDCTELPRRAKGRVAMSHVVNCGSGRRLLSVGKWGHFTREKHVFYRLG